MTNRDKHRILVETEQRVFQAYRQNRGRVEQALFDTIYEERRRLETEPDNRLTRAQNKKYQRIYREALKGNGVRQAELLKEIIRGFSEEVVGHFDPGVYALSTRVVPPSLNILLNAMSPLKLLGALPNGLDTLEQRVEITGETETLKTLAKQGTTILVSTHASNLDSLVLGFILYRLGLPPYTYGAGLNLFSNKMIGFFMQNLGAYKVDRRKKARVYKDVLKAYAGCTMELGYHNMFFPGGTRSRSGSVEGKLKMGLLGMALNAYVHNLIANRERPDLFVVPCTINYQLVLEAETLIDDHLKEVGKSRYIIEDDEFSKPHRVLDFVRKLFSLDSKIHVVLSSPLDVFGNRVDTQGRSLDHRGREIDRRRYVFRDGRPAFDEQRDQEYTRELACSIIEAFHRDTMIKSTNLVCRAVFQRLRQQNPEIDLYRLLRTGGTESTLPLTEVYQALDGALASVRALSDAGAIRLDDTLMQGDAVALMSDALAHLKSYHTRPGLLREGDRLVHVDRNLLLYYQNRLEGFPLQGGMH